ncbi:Sulfate permease CysP [Pseudooceanicola marinus]|uniref:Phosphate transporter n=1 Tax=Pseudooceanicola marinus TaxID=396013 RepID=A0A1X6Y487_9RHOB|nr:inorganic phosphate transporter [Pseudooceanicola marinus]SLN10116.1 Sulfate permease CysP [Pseudooceanicola marinus]
MKGPLKRLAGRRAGPNRPEWGTLDRDLDRLSLLEAGAMHQSRPLLMAGVALAFIVLAMLLAAGLTGQGPSSIAVVAAAALGAYMALNIGANDVANNMGPAVGAGALPMAGAIALAAVFESAGALIAGHDVIETVSRGILDPGVVSSVASFPLAMIAALLGAALWVNLATWLRAPVSTTQAVVGGMLGAGGAAAGLGAVQWQTLGLIAGGWVLSPLMGALTAAGILGFVRWRILYVPDKIAAARRWVPVLLGVMAAAFTAYLLQKAPPWFLSASLSQPVTVALGLAVGLVAWLVAIPVIGRQSRGLENRRSALKPLFRLPLICAAALLSFAHGANDVANAVAPLAALVEAQRAGGLEAVVPLPLWVTLIGAGGISMGLILFGPRLIRLVGREITRLNPPRAFCIALAAAVTVLLASSLGLPVSSTHVTIGGVFGVGFYREWVSRLNDRRADKAAREKAEGRTFPLEERRRRRLVRRSHFMTIIAAWLVTLPAAGLVSALAFTVLDLLG